jgi:hypothetical protein
MILANRVYFGSTMWKLDFWGEIGFMPEVGAVSPKCLTDLINDLTQKKKYW